MTRYLFAAMLAGLILTSCTPSNQRKAAEIEKLENEIRDSSKKNVADTAGIHRLMTDYKTYIKSFPKDSLTPVYMMRSAKWYDFQNQPDSATYYYNLAYVKFPDYPKADLALFSEAFIFANEKHNIVMARALYKDYLAKYPSGRMAKSAKLELDNLGKTPEQIMAELDSMKQARKADAGSKP